MKTRLVLLKAVSIPFFTLILLAQNVRIPPAQGETPSAGNVRTPPAPPMDVPDPEQVAELVLANHILASQGVIDAYGHVSVRSKRHPDRFLLARHLPAGVITAADILEYDLDSKPVHDPGAAGYSERFIHGEIYRARPDVKAVVHLHAADVIPYTVTKIALKPMIHMAGFLPQQIPLFEIRKAGGMTDMLVRTAELGHALAETLGSQPVALMRGHGAVVVADSLHVVVGRSYYMTVNARTETQALMLSNGKVTFLDPEEAAKAASQDGFERAWTYWKYELEHE